MIEQLLENKIINPNWIDYRCVEIGANNEIGPFVTIGTKAQHWDAYPDHPEGKIYIGNNNIIREFVTVQRPIISGKTIIGDNNFIMCNSHIAHDVILEDWVAMSPSAALAGHCYTMHHATLGMHASVHQYRIVGSYTIIGMNATVTKDVPPFTKFYNDKIMGLNKIGMQRNNFSPEEIQQTWNYLFGNKKLPKSERVRAEFDFFEKLKGVWAEST